MTPTDYAAIRQYASPRQAEIIDALVEHGSVRKAAKALDITKTNVDKALARVRRAAARVDIDQHTYEDGGPVPDGFHLRGISTQVGPGGNVISKWIKSAKDSELREEALLEALRDIAERLPAAPVIDGPTFARDDLLCVYPMGDPHIGMYAWAEECGASFDLDIAERQIAAAVDRLVELAPAGTGAMIIDVGDFFHSDTLDNRTRRSGHALDVDTRWAKVLRVGIRTMTSTIDRALAHHSFVRVVIEIGNHDDQTSIMLAICLAEHYRDNPRVFVDTSPAPFHYHRFGLNLIGTTHGLVKARELGPIMAADRPQDWGETKHRYWYTGHVHHDAAKEFTGGVIVESFRTLAPRDAWHNAQGYRSGQDMRLDILHREYGRINRHIVGIEEIRARMGAQGEAA